MDIKVAIGRRVKELRQKQNISQETLAYKSSLDRTYINSIENGRRNVSIVNIERISFALGISLREFFNTSSFEYD